MPDVPFDIALHHQDDGVAQYPCRKIRSMNPPTQRRLAAIVSADVVGYSRLMGIDEAGTLAALRAHRSALIDPKISDHGGRIVKTMGDGLLLEFPSVVDATVCAIEVQEAMTARNAEVEEGKRIVFRIGVHVGDIIIDGEDILGDGVNIAARVEALAEPGGVAITGRVHDDVMDRLEVSFSDTGERSLKNIARPVRVWQWKPKESPTVRTVEASALPDIPAVAVLPFKNMSRDPEQDYFSDGISEELITELSRYRDFRVLSRSSTSAFKDQSVDPVQVAQKLGVRFVVEGSVRRAGRRIRVNAQLTEGKTGNHIWAERYDREMEDIFEVQDDIARTIASTLGGRIVDDSVTRSLKKNSNEVDAYDLTLQSNAYFLQLNPESNRKSRDLALRAIELAPDFARAHAALSFSHTFDVIQLWGEEPTESMKVALDAAIMATSLDDKDEPSNAALGFAELFSGNHDRAIEVSQKAIRLNPNHADAHARLASSDTVCSPFSASSATRALNSGL